MKATIIQALTLAILMLSINQSYALIYEYRYQGNALTTMRNRNDSFPLYTEGDAISFSIQLSQALPADPATFNTDTMLLLSAWDGTQLISTSNGASYSISLTIDPITGLPPLGGIWNVLAWQEVPNGTHSIATRGNGWAGAPGSLPEGSDTSSYILSDGIYNPWDDNYAWNCSNPGTWSMSILPENPAPVPEPCTFLLIGAGLLGMFSMRKRIKR
jgi:hypothetical protein